MKEKYKELFLQKKGIKLLNWYYYEGDAVEVKNVAYMTIPEIKRKLRKFLRGELNE